MPEGHINYLASNKQMHNSMSTIPSGVGVLILCVWIRCRCIYNTYIEFKLQKIVFRNRHMGNRT